MFPAFFCANNIGYLVNSLFGIKTFNPSPSFTYSSSPSSGGISGIWINSSELSVEDDDVSNKCSSSPFCLLNVTLSEVVSYGCRLPFSSSSFFDSVNF